MIYETDTDRILVYDGTGWVILSEPSVSFTPSVSGLTVGDGSWSARYRRSDGWIDVEGSFTFGLTSAIVSGLTMTLPIGSATTTPDLHSVSFYDFDTNSQYVAQATYVGTTTTVALRAVSASSAYAVTQGISATVPFTWTKDDLIQFGLRYRMASRYS